MRARRAQCACLLTALFAVAGLGGVPASGHSRPQSHAAACAAFDITGTWAFTNPNRQTGAGHSWSVTFNQAADGTLTGHGDHPPADVTEFGYPAGTTWRITSGHVNGTRAIWETTPSKAKTDGSGAHTGVYDGTITEASSSSATMSGETHDKQVPASHGPFDASGPATCAGQATEPQAPEATKRRASSEGQAVSATVAPGAALEATGPALGATQKSEAVAFDGVSDADVDAIAIKIKAILKVKQAKAVCYTDAAIRSVVLGQLYPDVVFDLLLTCLTATGELYSEDTSARATAAACHPTTIGLIAAGHKKVRAKILKRAAAPKGLKVSCSRSGSTLKLTVTGSKPLRKLLGPRLLAGVVRSKNDSGPAKIAATFTKR